MGSAGMTHNNQVKRIVEKETDTARVKVFPPALYVSAIVLGFGLNLLLPVRILPTGVQLGAGIPIVLFSVFLAAVTFREFFKHGTSSDHKKPAKLLITSGPFRCSRNPLYISGMLLVVGTAVLVDSVWTIGLLLPVILIVRHWAILPEEGYLARKFGEKYLNYKSTVRRWL
jgi:protein-S-isoprenylcysteine O-methyltransferase Ste14